MNCTALCFTECLKIFVVEVYQQLATNERKVSITTVNEEISSTAEYFHPQKKIYVKIHSIST